MNYSFTKLFSTITDSSIWAADSDTRVVWVTMLSMCDRQGRVFAALPGLANRARVALDATQAAINLFLSPDKYSRTPDNEGRRIEVIQGGWRILNYKKYREMRDEESERERKREWAKNRRSASKVAQSSAMSTQAEAEAEAEVQPPKPPKGGLKVVIPEVLRTPQFEEHWVKWLEVRRSLRKVKDWETLFQEQLNWLQSFGPDVAAQILQQSIRQGWTGLFEFNKRQGRVEEQSVSATTLAILRQKELDEVQSKMNSIHGSYSEHQSWSFEDKEKWGKLRMRKLELKKLLGMET